MNAYTAPGEREVSRVMQTDPLSAAVAARDRDVIAMVEEAVRTDALALAFQPIVTAGGRIRPAFYEGLIRVRDPSGRVIPARQFIDQVERLPLGRRIDAAALRLGLRVLSEQPHLRLSVNMSALSIGHGVWMETLDRALSQDPDVGMRLILEITERTAIEASDVVREFMTIYQNHGVSFAIDDFGAGHTSLSMLKDLYFDILKIDGSFVTGIAGDADNRALVRAIVAMARHFDMVTIAERVETAPEAEALCAAGVDCLQGYLFGAPTIRPRFDGAV